MSAQSPAPVNRDLTELPSFINSKGDIVRNDALLLQTLYHHLESSKAFLRSNKAWKAAEINRKILHGDDKTWGEISNDSRIEINKLRRQGRETVGNAANIRPNFDIRTPKNDESSKDKSATYEDLKNDWWQRLFIDRTFKEATHEAACSIGYLWTYPKKDPNTGYWDIFPEALDYSQVYPYQIGPDNNLDKAYNVTIRIEMPLSQFKEEFPQYANSVEPDRSAPSYMGKGFTRAVNKVKGLRGMLRRGLERKTDSIADPSFPTKDVFYTWTRDITINDTDKAIRMGTLSGSGELAGHESYEVPAFEAGKNTPRECRIFPFRRLTIWTWGAILFDGPPKWICFGVPVAELRFERLPKEYLGVPILNDGRSLEAAINKMMNSIIQRVRARSEFPIGIDEAWAQINKQTMHMLEKRGLMALIGKGIKMNFRLFAQGKPIQALFDKDLWAIEQHEFEIIKSLMELQDYVIGTNDFSNLQRKNQLPAADTQEALIQSLGVISVDYEREISLGVAKFGKIWLQFAPQVYTLQRRLTLVGSPALDIKDIDWEPESLVPSPDPGIAGSKDYKPYWVRLKEHLEKFNLIAMPGSLQERQSITKKLTLLQMLKSGVSIPGKKLHKVFINDGEEDKDRTDWEAEQTANAVLAAKIRIEVERLTGAGGSPEGQGLIQQLAQALQLQNTSGEGRPSSDASAPRQEIKSDADGTSRATTATYTK